MHQTHDLISFSPLWKQYSNRKKGLPVDDTGCWAPRW